MSTKTLTLSLEGEEESLNICFNGSSPEAASACLLTFGVIVPAGTFIVSGSIVLVNNTLHWLEYQGRCDKGLVRKHLNIAKMDTHIFIQKEKNE